VHIALKNSLRYVPFGGWSLQLARFLFLRRKWELDESFMTAMLRLIAGEPSETYQLVIFPVSWVAESHDSLCVARPPRLTCRHLP
jgi:1-acyl-sn-glycerol-3-phosphate acyltransferase